MLPDRSALSCVVLTATVGIGIVAAPCSAQYDAEKVKMYSQVTLSELQSNSGNDCWGYVSPSGREYVIMGTNVRTTFIDITDALNPVIVLSEPHADSFTGDIKVYGHYAYSIGDGYYMQIFDMSDIDNGNVARVATPTFATHNIAINEDSGYAYLCASNMSWGIAALDLSNPTNPVFVGETNPTGNHVHDAQVVTYTSGPYAGKEIAFCPSGQSGLDIIDVTNKSNMTRLSHTFYPGTNYSHQCWLSEDRQYLYLNDELDELNGDKSTTTTFVFDVSDLSAPVLVDTFTSGTPATDHNLYVHEGIIYQANYRSGLRIFDARSNPTSPPQVGYFDTYPANDNTGFDGAWSVYPFFPSGVVAVSDINRGLFVLDVSEAIGEELVLDSTTLVGGQNVTMTVTNATPNKKAFFVYSLTGAGWTKVSALNTYLELLNPKLAVTRTANGAGSAQFTGTVPSNLSGTTIWLEAAQIGRSSNLLEEVVQ